MEFNTAAIEQIANNGVILNQQLGNLINAFTTAAIPVEPTSDILRPADYGAVPGVVSDAQRTLNVAAFNSMFAVATATSGTMVELDAEVWEFNEPIAVNYGSNPAVIHGSSATLRFAPVLSNNTGTLAIYTNNGLIDFEGWGVDANSQSCLGLFVENQAVSFAQGVNWRFVNIFGINCLATSNLGSPCVGIAIRGWCEWLVCRGLRVDNIGMEAGVGVPGSYGTVGIYIGRVSVAGGYPVHKEITDTFVGDVYSEDLVTLLDMDGMDIFDDIPAVDRPRGSTHIRGYVQRNPQGRGIKVQALNVSIVQAEAHCLDGAQNPWQRTSRTFPMFIDFQWGEGDASDITAYCHNCGPVFLVIGSLRTYAGGTMTLQRGTFRGRGASIPALTGFVWRYAEPNSLPGDCKVTDCSAYGVVLAGIAYIVSRPAGGLEEHFVVNNNSTLESTTTGVLFESDPGGVATATMYGNHNFDTAVPLYSTINITMTVDGAAANNPGYT